MQKKNEQNYQIFQNTDWQQQKFANYYFKYAWILSSGVIKLKIISSYILTMIAYASYDHFKKTICISYNISNMVTSPK